MAAGQGFKTFTTGEVLTAGDVNGYLMQGINVFTNATARDAAITAPAEGQFAFTKDNNSLWYYDGAAWVASGATGDIEGVTAGVGISGGGTSGTVTITNSMATAITTAGDLIRGTGSGTFERLGIGSTGQVLTVASGVPAWASPAGGGKILQVVSNVNATSTSTTSTSYIDSGLTASITPSSTSSRIYVIITQSIQTTRAGNDTTGHLRLLRGATTVWNTGDVGNLYMGQGSGTETTMAGPFSVTFVDSPATTSSTTYKTQIRNSAASQAIAAQFNNSPSTITLMEIGA